MHSSRPIKQTLIGNEVETNVPQLNLDHVTWQNSNLGPAVSDWGIHCFRHVQKTTHGTKAKKATCTGFSCCINMYRAMRRLCFVQLLICAGAIVFSAWHAAVCGQDPPLQLEADVANVINFGVEFGAGPSGAIPAGVTGTYGHWYARMAMYYQ